jgi:hypothetical protein
VIPTKSIQSVRLAPEKDVPASATRAALFAIEFTVASGKTTLFFADDARLAKEWVTAIQSVAVLGNSELPLDAPDATLEVQQNDRPILLVVPLSGVTDIDKVEFDSLRSPAISVATKSKQFMFIHFVDYTSAFFKIQEYVLYQRQTGTDSKSSAAASPLSGAPSPPSEGPPIVTPLAPEEEAIKEFHEKLRMPQSEELLQEGKCVMWQTGSGTSSRIGRLFVSNNYLAFYTGTGFLTDANMTVIPIQDIKKLSLVQRGVISVTTKGNDFYFAGFCIPRLYACIFKVWDDTKWPKQREIDSLGEEGTVVCTILRSRLIPTLDQRRATSQGRLCC